MSAFRTLGLVFAIVGGSAACDTDPVTLSRQEPGTRLLRAETTAVAAKDTFGPATREELTAVDAGKCLVETRMADRRYRRSSIAANQRTTAGHSDRTVVPFFLSYRMRNGTLVHRVTCGIPAEVDARVAMVERFHLQGVGPPPDVPGGRRTLNGSFGSLLGALLMLLQEGDSEVCNDVENQDGQTACDLGGVSNDPIDNECPDGYYMDSTGSCACSINCGGSSGSGDSGSGEADGSTGGSSSGGANCGDERDTMIGEYQARPIIGWVPTCDDLDPDLQPIVQDFSWVELNGGFSNGNPHEPFGHITPPLAHGLQMTRASYGRGGILLTSGYRCPHGNDSLQGSSNTSNHMRGRAADMYSADHPWTEAEFTLLREAAVNSGATEAFLWSRYLDHHFHAAW